MALAYFVTACAPSVPSATRTLQQMLYAGARREGLGGALPHRGCELGSPESLPNGGQLIRIDSTVGAVTMRDQKKT